MIMPSFSPSIVFQKSMKEVFETLETIKADVAIDVITHPNLTDLNRLTQIMIDVDSGNTDLSSISSYEALLIASHFFLLNHQALGETTHLYNSKSIVRVLIKLLLEEKSLIHLVLIMKAVFNNYEKIVHAELFSLTKNIKQILVDDNSNTNSLINTKYYAKLFGSRDEVFQYGVKCGESQIKFEEIKKEQSILIEWTKMEAYSRFLLGYYKGGVNNYESVVSDLLNELREYRNPYATKRILPLLIIEFDNREDSDLKSQITQLAFKLLGDPLHLGKWAPFDLATIKEKENLSLARSIVNKDITKALTRVFFEVCIDERSRKEFWMKLYDVISSVRVYVDYDTKRKLLLDSRVKEYVNSQRVTIAKTSITGAALILSFPNHVMVEFGELGNALYVFDRNIGDMEQKLNNARKTADFKNKDIGLLIKKTNYGTFHNDEGRFIHHGGNWCSDLFYWLKDKEKDATRNKKYDQVCGFSNY